MAVAVFLIIVMNMFARIANAEHTTIETVFYRNLVALILVVAVIISTRNFSLFKTTRLKDQIIRGTSGTVGMSLVFWAYTLMPMADVVAVMFTAGLMTTGISAIWLKEKVGPYRWGAVILGFVGAMIIAAPGGESEWNIMGVLVALGAAFIGGAVVSVMLRSLGKTEPALTTVFYFLSIGLILTLPFAVTIGHMPSQTSWQPLLWCGLAGGLSLILKTQAFRYAEASLLSPVQYTSIIWATLLGFFVFSEWPADNVLLGAGVIILSNLVILWREKKRNLPQPPVVTTPQ